MKGACSCTQHCFTLMLPRWGKTAVHFYCLDQCLLLGQVKQKPRWSCSASVLSTSSCIILDMQCLESRGHRVLTGKLQLSHEIQVCSDAKTYLYLHGYRNTQDRTPRQYMYSSAATGLRESFCTWAEPSHYDFIDAMSCFILNTNQQSICRRSQVWSRGWETVDAQHPDAGFKLWMEWPCLPSLNVTPQLCSHKKFYKNLIATTKTVKAVQFEYHNPSPWDVRAKIYKKNGLEYKQYWLAIYQNKCTRIDLNQYADIQHLCRCALSGVWETFRFDEWVQLWYSLSIWRTDQQRC